jgi:hypothetical protein
MSCNSCNNTPLYYLYNINPCVTNSCSSGSNSDSSTVIYTGPNLPSIGIDSNDNLQSALGSINTAVGEIEGIDWTEFDYFCLDEETGITTAQEFVETISEFVCDLSSAFTTFSEETYVEAIEDLQEQIDAINEQGLTSCEDIGIVEADELPTILSKIIANLCEVNTAINPSGADWTQCYAVDPLPSTIEAAFDVIIDQICGLKADIAEVAVLPVFDNTGTCLPDPGEEDTLVDTIEKITTYLCELPEFDINDITWQSCIANPNPGGGADLISTFNIILSRLQAAYALRVVEFDSDFFTTSYSTPGQPCSGVVVTLNDGIPDVFFALNEDDETPGYFEDKITAGDNIEFDTDSVPGTLIINSTAEDVLVKANAGDTAAGYLIDKIDGKIDSSNAISLVESYNSGTDKVDVTPVIDYTALAAQMLSVIGASVELSAQLCEITCACECTEANRTVTLRYVVETGETVEVGTTLTQSNPDIDYISINEITIPDETTMDIGAYAVTSTDVPLTGTFTLQNKHATDNLFYLITVIDPDDNPVPGSSTATGDLAAGNTLTISPFTYGSVQHFTVNVNVAGNTTSTTTTTTTV